MHFVQRKNTHSCNFLRSHTIKQPITNSLWYGCETWSMTKKEKVTLNMWENTKCQNTTLNDASVTSQFIQLLHSFY